MMIVILTIVIVEGVSTYVMYHLTNRRLHVIHDLVNSNLTRVQADLQMAQQRIAILEQHLADTGRVKPA